MGEGILGPGEVGVGEKNAAWLAVGAAAAQATQGQYQTWRGDSPFRGENEPGGSGGFEFPSAEAMTSIISQWEARRDSIVQKTADIDDIRKNLTQLAQDQESQAYLTTARDSIELLKSQHESMLKFIENYIDRLTKVKNGKQANEDNTKDALVKGIADPYQ